MPSAMYSRIRAATVSGSPTSAVPAPPRTRPTPGPQVGADLELVAPAAVQPAHALLADRIHAREHGLRLGDARVVDVGDQPLGLRPGLGRGLADDDVQADAEAQLAAARGRRGRACSILSATSPAGSPQVRYMSTCSAAISMPASDEPPN